MVGAKILLVDDDMNILAILKYRLELQGYEIVTATNASAAERQVAAEHPNLVLLDVMMPGQDGVTVCRRLKHDHQPGDLPRVIMLSAVSDQRTVDAAFAAGASGWINKPFNFTTLISEVDHYLTDLPA